MIQVRGGPSGRGLKFVPPLYKLPSGSENVTGVQNLLNYKARVTRLGLGTLPVELAEREALLDEGVEQPVPLALHLLLDVGRVRSGVVLGRQVRQNLIRLDYEMSAR